MDRNYSWEDQNPEEMQTWHEFQGQILQPEFIDSVAFQVDESSLIQSDEDELDDATRIEYLLLKLRNGFRSPEERKLLKAYENHLSGDLNATVELGNHLVRLRELTFAESLFQLAHDSGSPFGTHALGTLEYLKGQYLLAEGHLKDALSEEVPRTHYPLYLVLAKLGKKEESDAHLLSAYSEKDVGAICELGLRSLSFGDTESAEIFFIEGMNLGHSQSARELIKLRKKARKRKVEVKLYKEALEDGNELALSALRFLLFSKYYQEILDLTDPNED
jgi:hypothetical protein